MKLFLIFAFFHLVVLRSCLGKVIKLVVFEYALLFRLVVLVVVVIWK